MSYLVILLSCVAIFQVVSAQTCDPQLDCDMIHITGETVPDPLNCEKFYVCIREGENNVYPSTTSYYCPAGEYYHGAISNATGCTVENIRGICNENYCGKLLVPKNPNCPVECPPDTLPYSVADPKSCSSYYECTSNGNSMHRNCPTEAPYFNGQLCVNDSSWCCDLVTPYCVQPATQVPDPSDCTSYYVCGGANEIPSQSYRFTCPDGEKYNALTYTCEPGKCLLIRAEPN